MGDKRILWLLLWATAILPLAAQPLFPTVFPKNTFAVISVADIAKAKEDFTTSDLYQLGQEPEIAALWKKWREQEKFDEYWREFSDKLHTATGLTLRQVLDLCCGELSIALIDAPLVSEPQLAFVFQFKEHALTMRQLLQVVFSRVPEWSNSYQIGEVKVSFLRGMETSFHYTIVADRLIAATSENLMRKLVANMAQAGNRLGENPQFQKHYAIHQENLAFLYADAEQFVEQLVPMIPPNFQIAPDALGMRDWRSLSMGFKVADGQILSRWHMTLERKFDKPKVGRPDSKRDWLRSKWYSLRNKTFGLLRGVNKFIPEGELDASLGDFIPATSSGLCAWRVDLAAIWKEFHYCCNKIMPEEYRSIRKELESLEQHFLGVKTKDLLKAIGPDHALFHLPAESGQLPPRLVAITTVRDFSTVHKALRNITTRFGYELESRTYQGRRIYYLAQRDYLTLYGIEQFRILFGDIAFFQEKNRLIVSRLPQTLMDLIDHYQQNDATTKLDAISATKEKQPYSMVAYLDSQKVFPALYSTILTLLPRQEQSGNLPFRVADLPRASTFTRHLGEDVLTLHNRNLTVAVVTRTTFAPELWVMSAIVLNLVSSSGALRELEEYLDIYQKDQQLLDRQQFYQSSQLWRQFFHQARLRYFRVIAEKQAQLADGQYRQKIAQVQHSLTQSFSSSYLQKWQLTGDWQWQQSILSIANENADDVQAIIGEQPISHYMLSFEAKQSGNPLQLLFHYHQDYRSEQPLYQTISLPVLTREEHWIPYKFKVHGNRISYWLGIRHYVVEAPFAKGLIGFVLPRDSKTQIRNLQLQVTPIVTEQPQKTPTISIECVDLADPVKLSGEVVYKITIRNRGEAIATPLTLSATLSPELRLIDPLQNGDTITFTVDSLSQGMKRDYLLTARPQKTGSATIHIAAKFSGVEAEVVTRERTHIIE